MKRFSPSGGFKAPVILASALVLILFVSAAAQASEDLYRRLSVIAKGRSTRT